MPLLLAAERMTFYLPHKFVVDCAAQALFERHGWYKICFFDVYETSFTSSSPAVKERILFRVVSARFFKAFVVRKA